MNYLLIILLILICIIIAFIAIKYKSSILKVIGGAAGKSDKREIEKRFSNFNYDDVVKKIKKLGGHFDRKRLFKVIVFETEKPVLGLRVRDEGDGVTVTTKISTPDTMHPIEHETTVGDFDTMSDILRDVGHKQRYYLEKYRETYTVYNTEIAFDNLPGLPPLMEVESPTEKELDKVIRELGLKEETPFTAEDLYEKHYGIKDAPKSDGLEFKTTERHFDGFIKKNQDMFNKILAKQRKIVSEL